MLPRIPAGPSRCRVFWPVPHAAAYPGQSVTLPRILAVRYARILCPRPARGIYIPCPAPISAPKNFRRVCAMRGAGLWLGHFRGIGMGRGPAPPVEPQRRQFPADPIVHRIMARLTKPDQVPATISVLREILHRPSVMRHSSRCSPAIACAVLAGTASRFQALPPKSAVPCVCVCVVKVHGKKEKPGPTTHQPGESLALAQVALALADIYNQLPLASAAVNL